MLLTKDIGIEDSRRGVKGIYRSVSQSAICFIAELDGHPIGECWLQRMNMKRILQKYPDRDIRRIDLMIGEKELWGKGHGTEIIRLLTALAFEREGADLVFAYGVADYNPRSRRAFEKNGYRLDAAIDLPSGMKAQREFDLMLSREDYIAAKNANSESR